MADLDLAGIITRVCADLKLRFASISHQHTIYDLPIGSTSTTVPLGNHTHSGYASSSHSHGSISSTGTIGSDTTVASGDKLVIIAGACQSDYEELIKAGANFASSPKRINIHALDPAIIASSLALTERNKEIDLLELLEKTKYGKDGIGGLKSNGLMFVGYPR